tara:strand:+ start:357 stop:572 length:216 start_codon:yes stop_codon:yes gene_type:complete
MTTPLDEAWFVLKKQLPSLEELQDDPLAFMSEEERRQYELRQKLDALRRITGEPKEIPNPSRRFPSAAGNA